MASRRAGRTGLTTVGLYHFSEDPHIASFEPHVAPTSAVAEPLVWAIDEWHQVMYYFPRDCPRACFWPGERTTDADRQRFISYVQARMVIAIESRWLERLARTTLYRYTMPEATFVPVGDDASGHWVSRATVVPISVEPINDLLKEIIEAGVELRITPWLISLWRDVIASSLQFSGTRLRNARGWDSVDWSQVQLGPYAQPPSS